jgi:hypothetical protein
MSKVLLRTSLALVCFGSVASSAFAVTYLPTKDTFFRNTGVQATNDSNVLGASASNRVAKDINTAFYLSDFDRAAITTQVKAIAGEVGALTLADMATVQLHWMVKANLGAEGENPTQNQSNLDAKYSPTTLQTKTPNWTEAGSTNNWVNWTGTAGTSTRWQDLSGTDMTTSDASGEINSRFHLRFDQSDPLQVWGGTADLSDSNLDLPQRDWLLSNALAFDFLTDPNVAGLAFIGDTNNATNMEIWSNDAANSADRPFLVVVAAVPEPASIALLGVGALVLIRRRRTA